MTDDAATPPEGHGSTMAELNSDACLVVLGQAERVNTLLGQYFATGDRQSADMRGHRSVLGNTHPDQVMGRTTPLTEPFHDRITRYAWGSSGPALARTTTPRSCMVLTAPTAQEHWNGFGMHVRAARHNGAEPGQDR